MWCFIMSSVVNKGLKVDIFPDKAMEHVLNQNMGNARFIWNNILNQYNELYGLFKSHGYPLNPNIRNLNAILKMLKQEHSFLREGESTSQQQVFRDLNKSFTNFFKGTHNYPNFKSKKNPKQSFRIQKNGNNIRITNRRIRLAKLGYVHYRTSKEYKKLLKKSKINNVTVKKENGKYYAIINITTTVEYLEKSGKEIGIDLGLKNLATLSNGQEIANLDLNKEDKIILDGGDGSGTFAGGVSAGTVEANYILAKAGYKIQTTDILTVSSQPSSSISASYQLLYLVGSCELITAGGKFDLVST